MRVRSISTVLIVSFVALGAYAVEAGGPLWPKAGVVSGANALQTVAPSPEAKSVLAAIRGYSGWPHFAENVKPKRSLAHNGMWVLVFHNDVVTRAVAKRQLPLPEGSLLVKENRFEPTGKVALLTVMSKQHGRWFWLEVVPAQGAGEPQVVKAGGTAIEGFRAQACAGCHEQNVDNDGVFSHPFAEE